MSVSAPALVDFCHFYASVSRIGRGVKRPGIAVAHGTEALSRDSGLHQIGLHCLGALLRQGEVFFGLSEFLGVAGHAQLEGRARFECFG